MRELTFRPRCAFNLPRANPETMHRANATPASSGWAWSAQAIGTPRPPPRGPSPPRRGSKGAVLAGVVFVVVAVVSLAAAAYAMTSNERQEADAPAIVSEPPAPPTSVDARAARPEVRPVASASPRAAPSLDEVAWTTDAPSTLRELSRAWSIPRDVLTKLNPGLPANKRIAAGAEVIVYSQTLGASSSVGPPNNGRLRGGVPLPEDRAWVLPEDRSRAFATAETIAALLAGLEVYAQRFPGADPIQLGDLSARRGGRISGHQSHQSGLDVDIRLITDSEGEGFDADRNWLLVKALIDDGGVTSIFLNATEQTWLRAAAEADVGPTVVDAYFSLIRHEPGHTIHMHIRFVCPKQDRRCVNYPLPDAAERDQKLKRKLPALPGAKLNPAKLKPRRSTK